MIRTDLFSGATMDTTTASSEELRQSLGCCSREWREAVLAELERRGEPFSPSVGRVDGLDDIPVGPYAAKPSPWDSLPGTLARHDEEEEAIHGAN